MDQKEIPMIFRRDTTSTTPKGRSYLITTTEPNVNKIIQEIRSKENNEIIADSKLSEIKQHSPKVPKYVENDKKVLRFDAFYLQPVYESPLENYRVRYCHILYYLEDDTIQIIENKNENSGLPSGTILKRQKIPKENTLLNEKGDEIIFHWKEFNVQETICIYSFMYRIIDADQFTRDYYKEKLGIELNSKEPIDAIPDDIYTITKNEQMSRETGKDPNRNYGKIQYPMKQFLEASLGKFHHSSEQCKLFLKYDRMVLRWYCSWDDTKSAFGQKHYYMIHYYLTDNTLEVKEIHERNSGYDRFPKLLGRQKLEKKELNDKSTIQDDDKKIFYSWSDFQIGKYINVYGRPLLLLDADNSTREWYKNEAKLNIENPIEHGKFEVSVISK